VIKKAYQRLAYVKKEPHVFPACQNQSSIALLNSLLKNYFQYKIKVFIEKEFYLAHFC